jgi:cell division septum initiation protein DivIVA
MKNEKILEKLQKEKEILNLRTQVDFLNSTVQNITFQVAALQETIDSQNFPKNHLVVRQNKNLLTTITALQTQVQSLHSQMHSLGASNVRCPSVAERTVQNEEAESSSKLSIW